MYFNKTKIVNITSIIFILMKIVNKNLFLYLGHCNVIPKCQKKKKFFI